MLHKTSEKVGAEFTMTVGDNFYSNRVKDVDDPRFKETFEVNQKFMLYLYSCHEIIVKTSLRLPLTYGTWPQ